MLIVGCDLTRCDSDLTTAGAEPLLKWPGGKRWLVKSIIPLLPAKFERYYEPFTGGAALFFALNPVHASLSDNNLDLICAYVQVRDNPEAVIERLRKLRNSEKAYYRVRAATPASEIDRAVRLIYLTTLSFNGIHRVNLAGQFNVPYGYKTYLHACDYDKIRAASNTLRSASIKCQDFELGVADARCGDFVYLDPPYTVAHGSNGFLKYNAKIFSWTDQERLANVARSLVSRGCCVVISNADHPSIRKLYTGFKIAKVERYSVIASRSRFRRRITECLFYAGACADAEKCRTYRKSLRRRARTGAEL